MKVDYVCTSNAQPRGEVRAPLKQIGDIRCRTIAKPYPDAFRRQAEKHGPLPEILILGNDHETVCSSKVPNIGVVRVR